MSSPNFFSAVVSSGGEVKEHVFLAEEVRTRFIENLEYEELLIALAERDELDASGEGQPNV